MPTWYTQEYGFLCCNCGATVGGTFFDYKQSLMLFEDEGWITRKVQGQYEDFCSEECYERYLERVKIKPKPRKIRR